MEQADARRPPQTTDLYHPAVLSDHVITKTAYLKDPEGQEIELYAESPKDCLLPVARTGGPAREGILLTWMRSSESSHRRTRSTSRFPPRPASGTSIST